MTYEEARTQVTEARTAFNIARERLDKAEKNVQAHCIHPYAGLCGATCPKTGAAAIICMQCGMLLGTF